MNEWEIASTCGEHADLAMTRWWAPRNDTEWHGRCAPAGTQARAEVIADVRADFRAEIRRLEQEEYEKKGRCCER